MARCLAECECTLALKVFLTTIVIYLLISVSLMIPSFKDYSNSQSKIDALDHIPSDTYECYQICDSTYRYFKQPNLCCNDTQSTRCHSKDQCKIIKLEDLHHDEKSALVDIEIGIGITIFWLIILIIIFWKKYATMTKQEKELHQADNNMAQADPQNSINQSLLKHSRSTAYKSFIEDNDQSDVCAICYQQFKQQKVIQLICNHKFHGDCIRQWLDKKHDCPVCRAQA